MAIQLKVQAGRFWILVFCPFLLSLVVAGMRNESAAGFSRFLVHEESLLKACELDK